MAQKRPKISVLDQKIPVFWRDFSLAELGGRELLNSKSFTEHCHNWDVAGWPEMWLPRQSSFPPENPGQQRAGAALPARNSPGLGFRGFHL